MNLHYGRCRVNPTFCHDCKSLFIVSRIINKSSVSLSNKSFLATRPPKRRPLQKKRLGGNISCRDTPNFLRDWHSVLIFVVTKTHPL